MTQNTRLPERLLRILRAIEADQTSCFPPTEVFNESWMLRLVLDAIQSLNIDTHPLAFTAGARWYSEALLESPFKASKREDRLAEGFTNADGVIGHFEFRHTTKAGLRLMNNTSQFVVTEAKMFSPLSTRTRNASNYDQAARNVACMAHAIALTGKPISDFAVLGFYVIAPQIGLRGAGPSNLEAAMEPASIKRAVASRISAYEAADPERFSKLRDWEATTFLPFVEHLEQHNSLRVLSWESCIEAIQDADKDAGEEIATFYKRCLSYTPSAPRYGRATPVEPDA